MTDAVPTTRTRPNRDRPLRTSSGPPSTSSPPPRCLAGLLLTTEPPDNREDPQMNHEAVRRQLAAMEAARQADLAEAFAAAVENHFADTTIITIEQEPTV